MHLKRNPEIPSEPEPTADQATAETIGEQRRRDWPRRQDRDLTTPQITPAETEGRRRHGWDP